MAEKHWPEARKCLRPPHIIFGDIPVPGRYDVEGNVIELDRTYYTREGLLETVAVLIHELAHWAVKALGIEEYHHHGAVWKSMLSSKGFDPELLRYALEDVD